MSDISLVARARTFATAPAIVDGYGTHSYAELLEASARIAGALLRAAGGAPDLNGERICYLVAPGFSHVATQWGILRAGGVAVPLCAVHPPPELAHVLDDAKPSRIVADAEYAPRLGRLATERQLPFSTPGELLSKTSPPSAALPTLEPSRHALLIYTSGTTGKPKAAITTHAILDAQLSSLATAWELGPSDRLLHTLPLHHLHGILNALNAPLYAGVCIEMLPGFDAAQVLARFTAEPPLSVFMGVPTMYAKLVQLAEAWPEAQRQALRARLERVRLIASGSAALPVTLLNRFQALSGHVLLERYGMTELGMALGNPLHGERRAGTVGVPFPGVVARIVDDAGQPVPDGTPGELQISGPSVFAGYFGRPDATRAAFTRDAFFRTGDVAVLENGYYRLLGRESVDIIKTGGFKVSALEIEETLREHPAIAEVAVVGVPDLEWGERVAAAVVLHPGASLVLPELRDFTKQYLAPYKVPSLLYYLEALPRNVMGKVNKPELIAGLRDTHPPELR